MSKQTDTNFFMLPPVAVQTGLYQRLLRGMVNYKELGNRVITEIKAAHAFRQVDMVRELAKILITLPLKEYQLIGQYYLVWCQCRELKYHTQVLERIIEQTQTYKAKGLLSRAAFEGYKGNVESELYFYIEALKASPSLSEYIDITRAIAIVKSKEGFHNQALVDIEGLIPIVRHAEPVVYCDVLNSYAVELCAAGRVREADQVSHLTISSPFGMHYPEWQETYSEVNQKLHKRRSTVSVSISKPKPKPKPQPVAETSLARVIKFPKSQAPEYKGIPVPTLTPIQWLAVMLKTMFRDRITDDEISRFCTAYFELIQEWDD